MSLRAGTISLPADLLAGRRCANEPRAAVKKITSDTFPSRGRQFFDELGGDGFYPRAAWRFSSFFSRTSAFWP